MDKIDRRRHYILVLDTETANTFQTETGLDADNALAYDIGWAVIDTHGTVYQTRSYVNRDIFVHERDLMRTAYYAKKIPQYCEDIRAGKRIMSDTYTIRKAMLDDIKVYNIKNVCAHNARFDWKTLDNTQRWVTKSKYRYWMPYGVIWWDSMKMARSVIHKMPSYKKFCETNHYLTYAGQPRTTAEALYRFIIKDTTFKENHTGLEDVLIEAAIVAYCYKQHKSMERNLFKQTPRTEQPPQLRRKEPTCLRVIPVMGG